MPPSHEHKEYEMRRYDDLRTLTFEINRTLGESLPHRFYALQFPEPWKRPLRELCRRDADTDQGYIPIRSLNAGIRALIPDIISTAKKAPEHGSRPWLYSSHSVETIAISAIVDSWVRTAFDKVDMARRQATLAGMPATDLSWATQDIDLNAWRVGDNGTAIVRGEVFTVLPDLLAAHLSRPGAECVLDETVLRFRRAPYTLVSAHRMAAREHLW